jgi:DNA-directed RNA polymerase specialized sigma54-like protein
MELRLQMTTQMIQSIELLQMPLLALQERVEQELEENPALEVEEEAPEGVEPDASADADQGQEDTAERAFQEELSDIEEEWNSSLGSSYRPAADDEDPKYQAIQNTAAPGPSLRDYLAGQLHMAEIPERLRDLAELIVYNLDAAGFLRIPLEEVFRPTRPGQLPAEPTPADRAREEGEAEDAGDETLIGAEEVRQARAAEAAAAPPAPAPAQAQAQAAGPDPAPAPVAEPIAGPAAAVEDAPPPIDPPPDAEEARRALELVQSLDPAGVGARDVRECLLIQLRRSPGDSAFEQRLVESHFDDLVQNRLPKIARDLGVDLERV